MHSHSSLGSLYCEASHPHAYYRSCTSCGAKVYTGSYAAKAHGSGAWGSGTCPSCGSHSYAGRSCTSSGVCSCGATVAAYGHSFGATFSEAVHPHNRYHTCSTCGLKVYTGSQEVKAHGSGAWGSGTCPDCGSHTFVGASCTTAGTCACGATGTSDTGHTYSVEVRHDSIHPHNNYMVCSTCQYTNYIGTTATLPHGNPSASGCRKCGSHTYALVTHVNSASEYLCTCGVCLNEWDLVDSGKHLDYSGNSSYMYLVDSAKEIWNGYIPGVIRLTTSASDVFVTDVYISDIDSKNYCFARTLSIGGIEINTFYFDDTSTTEANRLKTVIHELGHALGLGHSSAAGDVMRQGQFSTNALSENDKISYD